jgi:hypothetical protein
METEVIEYVKNVGGIKKLDLEKKILYIIVLVAKKVCP